MADKRQPPGLPHAVVGSALSSFAARFGILPATLRDWEQNRRHPDGAARVLLMVIDKEPDAVTRALALV